VKATALFAAATLAIVGGAGWVFTRVYPGADGRRAVLASAAVAVVVQLLGFAILQLAKKSNPIGAWGLGALLRMGVLAVYALVVVQAFGLASAPALLSLATFFFLSTLVEPLLLNV
jgi:hypothetical protein